MIQIIENRLDIDTYLFLRESVAFKTLKKEQAKRALQNSIITITAYIDGKVCGMGRIVGDGAVICYIQDLVVHPDYRGMGVGKEIMNTLMQKVIDMTEEGSEMMLSLMCAKGREEFYEHFGFIQRPTDSLGPGMIKYIKK
jgi:GNAT superfamily N-acetyltransferase